MTAMLAILLYTSPVVGAVVTGTLENGLPFTLVPSEKGLWVKLTLPHSIDKEDLPVSLLTRHVQFFGTEGYSRQAIIDKLEGLGLSIVPESFAVTNENAQSLQFSLFDAPEGQVQELLSLINQITFSPTFSRIEVEVARNQLLENCDNPLLYQAVTAEEVKAFHGQWYRPANMHLTLAAGEPEKLLPLLEQAFNSKVQLSEKVEVADIFTQKIEWISDPESAVVDGKIWMSEPNWINSQSNGRTLGGVLAAVGIGAFVISAVFASPVAIVAGILSCSSGVYFISCNYLKDPQYIEALRQTDLDYGCAYAYKKGRAGLTLTPYERRALFLQEMVDTPEKLPKRPILVLADLYQLNDPVIAEIFTVDEFNVINRLKRDFVQQRNQHKMFKENLERELATLTAPYAIVRDNAFLHAQDIYNQNYYVVAKANLKIQRDACIADYERAFENGEITLEDRDAMVDGAIRNYQASLEEPSFRAGLNFAEMCLAQAQAEIQNNYAYQVELAKQTIQYNQRMTYYNQGEAALVNYFDQELRTLLTALPVYYGIFPDFLDLR